MPCSQYPSSRASFLIFHGVPQYMFPGYCQGWSSGGLLCYATQVQGWGNKMFLGQRRWKGQSGPRSAWEVQWASQGWQGQSWRWALQEHQWGRECWPGMGWNGVLGCGQGGWTARGKHVRAVKGYNPSFWVSSFTRFNSNYLQFLHFTQSKQSCRGPPTPKLFSNISVVSVFL